MVINKEPLRACEEAPVLINYTRAAQSFVLDVVPRARVRLFGPPRKKTPPRFSRSPHPSDSRGALRRALRDPLEAPEPTLDILGGAPGRPRVAPLDPAHVRTHPRSPRVPEPPSSPRPAYHPQRPQRPRLARAAPSPRRPRVRSPSPPHSAVRTSRVRPRAAARNRTPTRTRTRMIVLQRRPRRDRPRLIRPRRLERIAKFSRLLRRRAHGASNCATRASYRAFDSRNSAFCALSCSSSDLSMSRASRSRCVRPVLALAPARLPDPAWT